MRGKLKKALSNLLAVAMFLSLLPVNAVTVMAEMQSVLTNADGVNNRVSFDATNPTLSGITAFAGQNGYAFPVYNTGVTVNAVVVGEYDVKYTVDGHAIADLAAVNDELASVTEHTQVKITE